ncbi:MAG: hypothetical protein K2K80_03100 [Clostridia bacterium]|nr:hypothetical protein [Clostridia bacterium]
MKYVRKIAYLLIATLMVAAVALGMCITFSVRNVNVSYIHYGAENDEVSILRAEKTISEIKSKIAAGCQGTLISSVDEEAVKSYVGDDYVMESFEKIYPCTINVKVRERKEAYAVAFGEEYKIYDSDGNLLRIDSENINAVDSAPNVLMCGAVDEGDIKELAKLGSLFEKNFSALRSAVGELRLIREASSLAKDRYCFVLRCGLTVELRDLSSAEDKLVRAKNEFAKLTGEQKLSGKIYCYTTEDGRVIASYTKNS